MVAVAYGDSPTSNSTAGLETTSTTVVVSGAAAPSDGEVLTAESPTAASWQPLPEATTGALGVVQLAGDIGGTAESPEVMKIQGTEIAAPSGGSTAYLNADGAWTIPAGGGGGGGFSNPMTTLGDFLYGGTSGVATRLAGSTSSRRKIMTQTGTGSVSAAPALYEPATAWVNVVDNGADPTEGSDSTSAFQAALNAAAAYGAGMVYAPAGNYGLTPPNSLTPALTIPSNVTLCGDGNGATTLVKNGNGPLLDFSGPGPVSQDANYPVWQGLRDIAINGNGKTGLLLRLYYLQFYYESNVYLYGNADVSVDMVQCWDSRITNGLYLGGGSASASAISGGQACTHLIRNSAAPATTLSAGISGTITALPVAALPEAMPAGVVQVWNASGQLQNFTTTGAASGATSIPVSSVAVAHTFVSGDFVNGFGWSGDSTNATWFTGCHWEAGLSGSIWITPGVGSTANVGEIKIVNTKVEHDAIGYDCPLIQVDPGCLDIRISQLYQFAGGYNSGYSTPVTMLYFHPDSGSLDHIWQSNGGTACVSTGIDAGTTSGWHLKISDVDQYWDTSPTVAGFNGNGGTPWLTNFEVHGTVTTPMTGTYDLINGTAGGGSGTVTTVSVASANGFAGSVANASTTPAITLSTSVTGLLKGNGTAVSAATAGTDYLAPSGNGSALTGLTVSQVSGAAPLASAALTGSPTAPTQTAGDNSTKIATDAFVTTAVAAETSRAETAEALLAPKANPTFTGTVTVPATVNATDAAQKQYVDSVAAGLDAKPSVAVLAASNITLSGTQTIDGVGVTAGQRVLCAGQSTGSQNGLWVVASGSWTRPADFASASSQLGAFAFVEAGTAYGSSGWVLVGASAITVDTTSQTWTQFSGAGEITAGTGLSKTGNTIALSTPVAISNGGTGTATGAPQNEVFAGPSSGGAGAPSFRALVAADVPTLNQSTTGNAATATAAAGLESATTTVAVSSATAPSPGQVLTATSSTAADWQTPSSGFADPMTTVGDIIYEGTGPTPARLAGNTTAAKQFLTQTGTGSASAAPAWGALASGDIPNNAANTSGSAGSFTGSLAGDVTGTQGATTVGKIQGVAVTSTEATLVSDLNNATARSATATLLAGEETVFTGSTSGQTLTLPASPPSSSINTITNTASVSVTLAPGSGATLSNFGTGGNISIPAGYTFAVVCIGTTWYVQSAGPADFAKSGALSVANGGTGAATAPQNDVFAGPSTGGSGAPSFRALVAADIPTLNQNTTGSAGSCTGNAATATNLAGGATVPAYLAPTATALTYGTTIAVNAALGNAFNLTLTGSTATISNPTSPVDGQVIRFRITQGTGGSFTVAWGTAYDFGASSAPTLSTTAAKVDIVAFEYVASISKWCYLGSGIGY